MAKQATEIQNRPKYTCVQCGKAYTTQKGKFYISHSPIYRYNKYIPICKECMMRTYDDYLFRYQNEKSAVRRMCMLYDIYFSEEVFQQTNNKNTQANAFLIYMTKYNSKGNESKIIGKTFANTIEEENTRKLEEQAKSLDHIPVMMKTENGEIDVSEYRKKWGIGYTPEEYMAMEERYEILCKEIPNDNVIMDSLIRDLCNIKILEARCREQNDRTGVKDFINLYQSTLNNANLKPKDQSKDGVNNSQPLGVMTDMIEKYMPAEYYKDKQLFEDYDSVGKYLKRFVTRPILNFLTGRVKNDEEYSIDNEED